MRGDLREREQEVRSKAGVEEEKDAIAADLKTLRAELAAAEAERRDGAARIDQLQQEKAAVERAASALAPTPPSSSLVASDRSPSRAARSSGSDANPSRPFASMSPGDGTSERNTDGSWRLMQKNAGDATLTFFASGCSTAPASTSARPHFAWPSRSVA